MDKFIAWDKENDVAILPERLPVHGEYSCRTQGKATIKAFYYEVVASEPEAIRKIMYSAFLDRFEVESLVAIESSNDPMVKVLEKKLQSKGQDKKLIDLDDKDLENGLKYYQRKGLLLKGDTPESLLVDGTINEVS